MKCQIKIYPCSPPLTSSTSPYTPDLTEGGIAYACRSLACSVNRKGSLPFDRLRHVVAGAATELAFRRYLVEQAVPFEVGGNRPFTDPDRYDVSLGGHRCELISYPLSRRGQVVLLRQNPALVLQAPALLPLDEFAAEGHKPGDLYLLAFLLGLVAVCREDVEKALAAGQPAYFIHPLPEAWARPSNWVPLEKLALKSECASPLTVEIGGQNAGREFFTAWLELPPKKRMFVK
jgi:hypothetical protein